MIVSPTCRQVHHVMHTLTFGCMAACVRWQSLDRSGTAPLRTH